MRKRIRICLFFSSFSPMYLIMLIQNIKFNQVLSSSYTEWFQNFYVAQIFLLFSTFPNVVLFLSMWYSRRKHPRIIEVNSATIKNSDVLNYIATYMIPFFSFKQDQINDLLAFGLLLIVLTIVYINANAIFINPILLVFGYMIYDVKDSHGNGVIVISKKKSMRPNQPISVSLIHGNTYLEVASR